LERLVVKELRELVGQVGAAHSGEAAEAMVLQWSRRVGRQVLEWSLQARVAQVEAQASRECECATHQPCRPRSARGRAAVAGQRYVHSRRPRTVLTLMGAVRVRRRYLRCRCCGAGGFAADEWLGWKGAFSHLVEEAVAHEVAALPYRQALAGLQKLCGIEISLNGARAIAARWGAAQLTPAPYQQRVHGRLVVEIDGTTAHLEDGWREVKVATCMELRQGQPHQVSYVADWLPAEQFAHTIWQEALARGAPTASATAVIGDGAAWIWETSALLFPRATEILDWYHASQHLWQAGRAVSGDGTAETTALVKRWESQLWDGYSEAVEEEMRELAPTVRDADEALRKTANYLATHQARLRYPLFRAAGWPIGSGVAEGGCKHVIDLRFKRKSTRWKKPGARAVLHLRLDRLNQRWDDRSDYIRKAA
jgi:hypothetical protein